MSGDVRQAVLALADEWRAAKGTTDGDRYALELARIAESLHLGLRFLPVQMAVYRYVEPDQPGGNGLTRAELANELERLIP